MAETNEISNPGASRAEREERIRHQLISDNMMAHMESPKLPEGGAPRHPSDSSQTTVVRDILPYLCSSKHAVRMSNRMHTEEHRAKSGPDFGGFGYVSSMTFSHPILSGD